MEPKTKTEMIRAYSTSVAPRSFALAVPLPRVPSPMDGSSARRRPGWSNSWRRHQVSLGSRRITARSRIVMPVPGSTWVTYVYRISIQTPR